MGRAERSKKASVKLARNKEKRLKKAKKTASVKFARNKEKRLKKAKKTASEKMSKRRKHKITKKKAKTTIIKLKKGGATDADCKDLAVTDCKMIEKERRNDVSLLNKLKSGKHCVTKGQREVRIARARWYKARRTWYAWRKKVTIASKAKVTISSQSYDTLT